MGKYTHCNSLTELSFNGRFIHLLCLAIIFFIHCIVITDCMVESSSRFSNNFDCCFLVGLAGHWPKILLKQLCITFYLIKGKIHIICYTFFRRISPIHQKQDKKIFWKTGLPINSDPITDHGTVGQCLLF